MDSFSVLQFMNQKSILVTGATGFLAKIFVEKILRIQPNVKMLFLLVRAEDANIATERMYNEVFKKDLFRVLKDQWDDKMESFLWEKVVAVPGDVSCSNLGIKDRNLIEEMWREIDVVVNFAATTNFDERYDVAFDTNTMGAFHVLSFANRCVKIKMMLHVSTAYVCGERSGLILENPFFNGETLIGTSNFDIFAEKELVDKKLNELETEIANDTQVTETMKDLGIKRSRLYGWPNTYVFTKAMGEMALASGHYKNKNMPIVIIRPTMITSTYKEPFPGWVEGLRTIDGPILGYGKGKLKCLLANPHTILDLIPADMVVNLMIVAMIANDNEQSSQIIYHVSSSLTNPIKILNLHEFMTRYFTKNPYINKNGKPVQVSKGTILDTSERFERYMQIRYVLPLKGLKLLNSVFCQYCKSICIDLDRKIRLVTQLVELYKPYMFFNGSFDDTNSKKLQQKLINSEMESAEMDAFNFDPKCIDWEDYIMNIHIPGLLRYVTK